MHLRGKPEALQTLQTSVAALLAIDDLHFLAELLRCLLWRPPNLPVDAPFDADVGAALVLLESAYNGGAVTVPRDNAGLLRIATEAARRGNVAVLAACIKRGRGALLQPAHPVETPLVAAAGAGQLAALDLLLEGGAPIDDTGGVQSPLGEACLRGQADCVAVLLMRGANCNKSDSNMVRPLGHAAMEGHPHILKLLLDRGVFFFSVEQAVNLIGLPASRAVKTSLTTHAVPLEPLRECVRLLTAAASSNEATPTAFFWKKLMKASAMVGDLPSLQSAVSACTTLDRAADFADAVQTAAKYGHNDIVAALLSWFPQLQGPGNSGTLKCISAQRNAYNPFQCIQLAELVQHAAVGACECPCNDSAAAMLAMLIRDFSLADNASGLAGESHARGLAALTKRRSSSFVAALGAALPEEIFTELKWSAVDTCRTADLATLRALASPRMCRGPLTASFWNRPDRFGCTPMAAACANDDADAALALVQGLQSLGARIDAEVSANVLHPDLPLLQACVRGRKRLVRYLLEQGARASSNPAAVCNQQGPLQHCRQRDSGSSESDMARFSNSALHWVAYHGFAADTVERLGQGVPVDVPDGRQFTPLRIAVERGHVETVEALLRAGHCPNKLVPLSSVQEGGGASARWVPLLLLALAPPDVPDAVLKRRTLRVSLPLEAQARMIAVLTVGGASWHEMLRHLWQLLVDDALSVEVLQWLPGVMRRTCSGVLSALPSACSAGSRFMPLANDLKLKILCNTLGAPQEALWWICGADKT